jgi:hypothetical protein
MRACGRLRPEGVPRKKRWKRKNFLTRIGLLMEGLGSNCWLESLVALASFRPSHEYCESDGMVLFLTNIRGTILSCLASLCRRKAPRNSRLSVRLLARRPQTRRCVI